MRLVMHPINPEVRLVRRVIEIFDQGGVVVYPTDSGYSLGCNALSKVGVRKLYHLKRAMKKYLMALMIRDFATVTEFARVENSAFRVMKKLTPGPYTFILPSTVRGRKILDVNRPEIGIRMPDCPFGNAVFQLRPEYVLLTTAAKIREDESLIDPEEIQKVFGHEVDIIVDLGPMALQPTTVIRIMDGEPEMIRMGSGPFP